MVATCVELSNAAAVGAVGTPVRAGEANGAFVATAVVKTAAADSSSAKCVAISANVLRASGAAPTTA